MQLVACFDRYIVFLPVLLNRGNCTAIAKHDTSTHDVRSAKGVNTKEDPAMVFPRRRVPEKQSRL